MKRTLAVLVLAVTILALPLAASAQWLVHDPISDINNTIHWTTEFTKWTQQISYAIRQYQQLEATYQWAQHVSKNLSNPDIYTILALFAVVDSGQLTRIDSVANFRHMVEGSSSYNSSLGGLYHNIYGQPLNLSGMNVSGRQDWNGAAARSNTMIQSADAASVEALALISQINKSLAALGQNGTYTSLRSQIQSGSVTPQQTAQAGAMSSLYTAQSVDKNTQVLSAMAAMEAQQAAQQAAAAKAAIQHSYDEQQYFQQSGQSMASEKSRVDSWRIQ